LARPLAAFSAAITQARTCGFALARHASRLASAPGAFPPPKDCMQARTIGWPIVIRQFSTAASWVSAKADGMHDASRIAANAHLRIELSGAGKDTGAKG
jgi:hypothetical protein